MTSVNNSRLWAVAQMTSGSDVDANLVQAESRIQRAAELGCELVALPENATFLGREQENVEKAESLDGPVVTRLRELAQAHQIHVLVGSYPQTSPDPCRPWATSLAITDQGELAGIYNKIHLFDVEVAGDRSYLESDAVMAGAPEPAVVAINGFPVGLSICFDLRFPWLYQALRNQGAKAIFIPAAFTVPTGRDHWDVLLRARAIETQAWVLAAGQWGLHDAGRRTFGRSMIIDPWGTVVATVRDGGDLAVAFVDVTRVDKLRERMPMRSRQPKS